ncbi:hypothetical protein SHI21_03940 [Bacteriovorax sp. PP10]|uniref:Lipoprotein n=1 Tax=Bacteriovorax antarcticus TaxID=3088717 RepID=A0ABU5VSM1_9BACT|nr:hypothetical protein [Bacteriovorax sp. PP10]MEA9355334.1 hypothetical protein [Bacteriovorax sp. PP10]
MKILFYLTTFIVLTSCSSTTFSLQGSSEKGKSGLNNCDGYPHGSVIHGYTSSTAPCTEAARTCVNGSWNGANVFPTCK